MPTERRHEWLIQVLAVATYIPLGILVRTAVLNWIVGPLYYVLFTATVPQLLARRNRT